MMNLRIRADRVEREYLGGPHDLTDLVRAALEEAYHEGRLDEQHLRRQPKKEKKHGHKKNSQQRKERFQQRLDKKYRSAAGHL